MNREPTIFAADIGGTRIKLGVVRGKRLLTRCEIDARANEGLESALERIAKAARKMCLAGNIDWHSLGGMGLSFPGIIELRTGKILSTPAGKFDDAKNLNVPKIAQTLLGLPTRICNDANVALAGEWRFSMWALCAMVSWSFPVLAGKSAAAPFLFFAAMMVLQFFLVWIYLPETKGTSLEELQRRLKIGD